LERRGAFKRRLEKADFKNKEEQKLLPFPREGGLIGLGIILIYQNYLPIKTEGLYRNYE